MKNKITHTVSVLTISGLLILSGTGVAQATPTQTTPETTAISYNDKHEEEASAIDGVTWQSGITFDDKGRQVQEVILHNGISATLTFADENNTLTIEASNGENYVFDLDDLKEQTDPTSDNTIGSNPAASLARIKTPNSCQVATGIAGIAHSALWGAAVGGAVGAGAGAVVGAGYAAFWWLVGTQC